MGKGNRKRNIKSGDYITVKKIGYTAANNPEDMKKKCLVCRTYESLKEIEKMTLDKFRMNFRVPIKLYKYFPNISDKENNINFSLQALENNTVFLQNPYNFDDTFDSNISLDLQKFIKYRTDCDDIQKYLTEQQGDLETLINEYKEYKSFLGNRFRVTCFTTTPYSLLMWALYANDYKGFCVEYNIDPNVSEYESVYNNLFPCVYSYPRPDITELLLKSKDGNLTNEELWLVYRNGILRKGVEWVYQDEWRFILPQNHTGSNFNISFYPISKVFFGNKMIIEERKTIIDICKKKNIPYKGMLNLTKTFFKWTNVRFCAKIVISIVLFSLNVKIHAHEKFIMKIKSH